MHLFNDGVKILAKKASLTNLRSFITEEKGQQFSNVVIESTAAVPLEISYPRPNLCRVSLSAELIMYPGPLVVRDGIVAEVVIKPAAAAQVELDISLEEAVQALITTVKGLPYRTVFGFSRKPLYDFYQDKEIVIDPGHGGADGGWRGPVDLWERDMAWQTAGELAAILAGYGARVVLTRGEGENPSWQQRLSKVGPATFCFVSVHHYGNTDREQRGTAVLYNPRLPGNEQLAEVVLERIINKVKPPARGIKADNELALLGEVPALKLEPVTITNWVDEGLLRNPYLHRKVALQTVLGIKQYFRAGEKL